MGAVMDSYNLVNSVHSTENAWMNIEVLRNQWGFEGIVMSDWTSVYSTLGAVNGGLDMECPKGVFFTRKAIRPLLENGIIAEAQIDEKVQHILQTFIAFGFFDSPRKDASIPEDNPESRQTALDIAREGVVLLKNEGALPFARKAKVLVMGPNAGRIPTGGGSGFVTPFSSVSIADGLKAVLGEKRVTVLSDDTLFASILSDIRTGAQAGFRARYYLGEKLEGNPLLDTVEPDPSHRWRFGSPMKELPDDGFSVRWEGTYCPVTDGLLRFVLSGDDGYRLSVNGKRLGGDWGNHALSTRTVFLNVEAGTTTSASSSMSTPARPRWASRPECWMRPCFRNPSPHAPTWCTAPASTATSRVKVSTVHSSSRTASWTCWNAWAASASPSLSMPAAELIFPDGPIVRMQ